MFAGSLEVRRGFARLVDVNTVGARPGRVLARLQIGVDGYPVRALRKGRLTDGVAVRILKLCRGHSPALGQRNTSTNSQRQDTEQHQQAGSSLSKIFSSLLRTYSVLARFALGNILPAPARENAENDDTRKLALLGDSAHQRASFGAMRR